MQENGLITIYAPPGAVIPKSKVKASSKPKLEMLPLMECFVLSLN